jgi:hypothetical protein
VLLTAPYLFATSLSQTPGLHAGVLLFAAALALSFRVYFIDSYAETSEPRP